MPKSVLKPGTSIYDYSPAGYDFTLREARAEYSRLRKIAEKRLRRMAESPYATSDIYRRYADRFKPLPRGASEERVRKQLYEVARFTELKTGSVSGMRASREKQIEAMHDLGYSWINAGNIDTFNDYMERIKKFTAAKNYDSEEVVDLFREADESGVDPMLVAEDFDDYLQGIKTIPKPEEEFAAEDQAALEEIQADLPPEKKAPAEQRRRKRTPAEKAAAKSRRKQQRKSRKRNR